MANLDGLDGSGGTSEPGMDALEHLVRRILEKQGLGMLPARDQLEAGQAGAREAYLAQNSRILEGYGAELWRIAPAPAEGAVVNYQGKPFVLARLSLDDPRHCPRRTCQRVKGCVAAGIPFHSYYIADEWQAPNPFVASPWLRESDDWTARRERRAPWYRRVWAHEATRRRQELPDPMAVGLIALEPGADAFLWVILGKWNELHEPGAALH